VILRVALKIAELAGETPAEWENGGPNVFMVDQRGSGHQHVQ